jgi:hypothetical protein
MYFQENIIEIKEESLTIEEEKGIAKILQKWNTKTRKSGWMEREETGSVKTLQKKMQRTRIYDGRHFV